MPYTMSIYPDETNRECNPLRAPKEGDLFRVIRVNPTTDLHWGPTIHIELKPVEEKDYEDRNP